jgi:hypothetical protein
VISNADVKAIVGTVVGVLSIFLACSACYICSIRARRNTKNGQANGNGTSAKDQHVLGSASNIVTSNVVVMGPVSNITVTEGNSQPLEEQPPKYEKSPRNVDKNC